MATFCDTCMHVQLTMCETCLTVQCLTNQIRTYEDCLHFIDDAKIIDVSGKDCIGGGSFTAITMTMQNGWQIRAHACFACQTNVIIREGNLSFICCTPPVVPVSNVTYVIGNSTAPGLSGTIQADMTKVRRYLTNKKDICMTTLTICCDTASGCPDQTYTLDNGCDPKSQTPV